jgi:hypothetical protein
MSLVTIDDYERLTGANVPPSDEARVQGLLDAASAAFQGATEQTIERARTTELVMLDSYAQALLLDQAPVYEADPDDLLVVTDPHGDVVPRDHYEVLAKSATLKHCDCRPWSPGCYSVTYSHGFDPVPPDVQVLIAAAVSRVERNPAGDLIAQQSAGSWSVTYRDGGSRADLATVGGPMVDRYSLGRGA